MSAMNERVDRYFEENPPSEGVVVVALLALGAFIWWLSCAGTSSVAPSKAA